MTVDVAVAFGVRVPAVAARRGHAHAHRLAPRRERGEEGRCLRNAPNVGGHLRLRLRSEPALMNCETARDDYRSAIAQKSTRLRVARSAAKNPKTYIANQSRVRTAPCGTRFRDNGRGPHQDPPSEIADRKDKCMSKVIGIPPWHPHELLRRHHGWQSGAGHRELRRARTTPSIVAFTDEERLRRQLREAPGGHKFREHAFRHQAADRPPHHDPWSPRTRRMVPLQDRPGPKRRRLGQVKGEYFSPFTSTQASPFGPGTIL